MRKTPKALFDTAVAAIAAEDWVGLAGLCDPATLQDFRDGLVRQYTSELGKISVDDYLSHAPNMPREVAEYHISVAQQEADPRVRLREELPTVQAVEALADLNGKEAYAAWLHGRSPRVQLERHVKTGRASRDAIEKVLAESRMPPLTFIGFVMEGDRFAHIVHRWTPAAGEVGDVEGKPGATGDDSLQNEATSMIPPQVITCKRDGSGEWFLLADYNLFGLGSSMFYVDESDRHDDAV